MRPFVYKSWRHRAGAAFFALTSIFLMSSATALAGPGVLEQEVIDLVNVERSNAGLSPLVYQERLAIAAHCHASDMAANSYFAHNSQDGSTPGARMERAGYVWGTWGENIAAGQHTAQQVMTAWMNSSGHRANILKADFTEIGIGHAYDNQSGFGHYWVQDFGKPSAYNPQNPVNNYCGYSPPPANPPGNPGDATKALLPIINLLLN